MRSLWSSRRLFTATLGILSLLVLGLHNGIDTSMAMASVAMAVAASNAFEKSKKPQE